MKKLRLSKEKLFLSLILLLSGILNFTNLSIQGYSNLYYAAGVKSMTMSWKNFFFVAFDPTSFVSIDKPPLGFGFKQSPLRSLDLVDGVFFFRRLLQE